MNIFKSSNLILFAALSGAQTGCTKTNGAADPAAKNKEAAADLSNGRAVFNRVCSLCHQPNGQGIAGAFPPLAASPIACEGDPKHIIRIVLGGLQGPIEVGGKTYNNVMPPQASALSDQDIADVLSFVRSSWGNSAPGISPSAVAALRSAVAQHPGPWTWAELKNL